MKLLRTTAILLSLASAAPASAATVEQSLAEAASQTGDWWESRDRLVRDESISSGALEGLMAHPDFAVRVHAGIVLAWRTDPERARETLTFKPRTDRNGRAIFPPETFEGGYGRASLYERLLHGHEPVSLRLGLMRALPETGSDWSQDAEPLFGALDEAELRSALVFKIRKEAADVARPTLALATVDASPDVRAEAARSIGWRSDGGELAEELGRLFSDSEAQPRAMAARATGWLGLTVFAARLVELTLDSDAEVRLHALRGLRRIDPAQAAALPNLAALAEDNDPRVRRIARKLTAPTPQ